VGGHGDGATSAGRGVRVLVWAGVALLGGAGALLRFAVDGLVAGRAGSEFPWGTFAVNVSGAFVLGLLAGAALHGDALLLAGTAALGSYTTFSTWMLEAHRLGEEGELWLGLLNIAASVLVGAGAVALGRVIG
jgi:fluoride exporter